MSAAELQKHPMVDDEANRQCLQHIDDSLKEMAGIPFSSSAVTRVELVCRYFVWCFTGARRVDTLGFGDGVPSPIRCLTDWKYCE